MKFIQKTFYILLSFLFLYFLYNSFFKSKLLKDDIINTAITWFYYIVPSISISYTTAILLYNYPLISKLLHKPLSCIFHFENSKSCSIYLISIIVGNPCSIKLITEAVSNNEISINEGNRLLRFSSFVSTIFLFFMFDIDIAVILLLFEILSSIVIAFFSPQKEQILNQHKKKFVDVYFGIINILPNLLLNILSTMIVCVIFTNNINNKYLNILSELTTGIILLKNNQSFLNFILLIILISTNGIAIILQSLLIIKTTSLSFTNYVKYRMISTLISMIGLLIIYIFLLVLG